MFIIRTVSTKITMTLRRREPCGEIYTAEIVDTKRELHLIDIVFIRTLSLEYRYRTILWIVIRRHITISPKCNMAKRINFPTKRSVLDRTSRQSFALNRSRYLKYNYKENPISLEIRLIDNRESYTLSKYLCDCHSICVNCQANSFGILKRWCWISFLSCICVEFAR